MSRSLLSQQKLFGLLELDMTGTVLYLSIESDNDSDGSAADVIGHNFFSEVAPFVNVEEFQQHLDNFKMSSEQANSFAFNCNYEDGTVPVKVILARINERSNIYRTKSLLVHIKQAY